MNEIPACARAHSALLVPSRFKSNRKASTPLRKCLRPAFGRRDRSEHIGVTGLESACRPTNPRLPSLQGGSPMCAVCEAASHTLPVPLRFLVLFMFPRSLCECLEDSRATRVV